MMRVPADQGLMLTAFTPGGVVLVMLFWASLPVTTPHPHECCKNPEVKAAAALRAAKGAEQRGKDLKDLTQIAP